MEIKIESFDEMIKMQNQVNQIVGEKLKQKPSAGDYVTAFRVELYEFINAIGVWKWWKHSATIDKARVLDELADCFAFYLSAVAMSPIAIQTDNGVERPREDQIRRTIDVFKSISEQNNDNRQLTLDLIHLIGTADDNMEQEKLNTLVQMGIAIRMAEAAIPDLTWDEVVKAYMDKSQVNIDRQHNNY